MQTYKAKNARVFYRATRDGKEYVIQSSTDGENWHGCAVFDKRYQWSDDAEDVLARQNTLEPCENPTKAGPACPAAAGPATQSPSGAEDVCSGADEYAWVTPEGTWYKVGSLKNFAKSKKKYGVLCAHKTAPYWAVAHIVTPDDNDKSCVQENLDAYATRVHFKRVRIDPQIALADQIIAPFPTVSAAATAAKIQSAATPVELFGNSEQVAFDYSGLDAQTVEDLHFAEREYSAGRKLEEVGFRRMADGIGIAHDTLCGTVVQQSDNGKFSAKEKTFRDWCSSIGVSKSTAYQLLQVSDLMDKSSPNEQKILEQAPATLLYAAAKPSAPAEAVAAVKSGDIKSVPEYKALLEELARKDAAITTAQQVAEKNLLRAEAAEELADTKAQRAQRAEQQKADAEKTAADLQRQIGDANQRAAEATAKIRELEARPIDVAVAEPDAAAIEKYRREGEERGVSKMKDVLENVKETRKNAVAEANALRQQLASLRPDKDDCQRVVDALFDAVEGFRAILRSKLQAAGLPLDDYKRVVARAESAAGNIRDTILACAPAGYDPDENNEEDFF